ncbi:flagella biosynthesis regulator Flk [Tatumella citrea]|uniref:Flagella biosynthesis regulator n=1 Tax=Tatumella citrea TaxID=53336 RepID=A0A1Y0LAE8_TATCI|nr:flagella biosynthesis regulator Flk [Tatumella citrea]ARU94735.1 hypothetical protein A7K98_13805 [Tatumella citrea]ARU98773.1 hypothetical protein A7K99_13790 [Tatumella citrea]
MQPLRGPSGVPGETTPSAHSRESLAPASPAALTTVQRTALERIIVKIMAISSLKSPELWAGIRHQSGVKHDNELLSSHFPAAEQWLTGRLIQEQNARSSRILLQQLTDLLPVGNNRQAVSHFIRQNFGQTVLSSLTQPQLQQVLTMLQNGQMDIPQPQQLRTTDRTLLPAEHQNLQQQVIKLTISGGGSPSAVWQQLFSLISLKNGDPIPSRFYPLLSQYLQARIALHTHSQASSLTLPALLKSLKQPPSDAEVQHLTGYCEQQFSAVATQPLTDVQAQDVLHRLFRLRAEQLILVGKKESAAGPQPLTAAIPAPAPASYWSRLPRSWLIILLALVIILLVWLF